MSSLKLRYTDSQSEQQKGGGAYYMFFLKGENYRVYLESIAFYLL